MLINYGRDAINYIQVKVRFLKIQGHDEHYYSIIDLLLLILLPEIDFFYLKFLTQQLTSNDSLIQQSHHSKQNQGTLPVANNKYKILIVES